MNEMKLIHAFTGDDSAEWWSYDVGDPDDDNSLDVDGDCGEVTGLDCEADLWMTYDA